jgi:YegS/Rv2252/BmrU family lipid kinase
LESHLNKAKVSMIRLLFIVNPISGRSSKGNILSAITDSIDMQKYDVTIRFTNHPGHATALASEAVAEGYDVVVAVGGDGTVNEVARALVGTDTALGILPCGSGNGLARHLHIPMNARKAVEIINAGEVDAIDVMTVNGQYCFCTAGVGYDAKVSADYAKDSRRGLVTYAKKAIGGWLEYEPEEYIIEVNGQILKRRAVAIVCANANQWGNDFHVAPKASLTDGLIDVTIIHPISFINAIPMPAQILGYSFDKNPDVETFRVKSLLIKRRNLDVIHVDGESMAMSKDLKIDVLGDSLNVIVEDLKFEKNTVLNYAWI